ncbi:MAG: glutathione S-transferase family protein [Gammaproteobacteria bacterium]|nr:glutathione S-transferase family protein [Gammaproteobacteria bacterium]
MIRLYNFGPFFGLPDASPFCMKADAYLRAAGLPFEVVSGFENLRHAPKGKLPYIEDDGKIIPDSAFILAHLKEKYGDPLDDGLTAGQKASAHAFIKMLDENLYWCMVHSRWIDDALWPTIRGLFFSAMPAPLRAVLPPIIRRGVAKSLREQGIGRHSPAEILEIARRDLRALSDFLGDKPYFFGTQVTTLDAVAYAFLAEAVVPPLKCELNDLATSFPNLVAFVERFRARYYRVI